MFDMLLNYVVGEKIGRHEFLRHQSSVGNAVADYLQFLYLGFGAHGYAGVNCDSVGDSAGFAQHGSDLDEMALIIDAHRCFLTARGESPFDYAAFVNN
jgi:hypothetical protein